MEPRVDLFSLVFLLGAAQGLFLVLALLSIGKGAKRANIFLALFLLVFSITLVETFLDYSRYYARFPWLIGILWPTNFLFGPLFLFYTRGLVMPEWTLNRKWLILHMLPFALSYLILAPLFSLPVDIKTTLMFSGSEAFFNSLSDTLKLRVALAVLGVIFLSLGSILQIGLYLYQVLRTLRKHTRRIKNEFSSIERLNLNWLRNIAIATLVLWILFAFTELFAGFLHLEDASQNLLHVLIAVLIYTMGYFGLRQPEIFRATTSDLNIEDSGPGNAPNENENSEKSKYRKSGLDDNRASALVARLKEEMQNKKLYLESGLTLPMLADALDSTPHLVSQVLNEKLGQNFFDCINEYRVHEAQRIIREKSENRLNVYAIALDSGFSSKSAFYTAFKRFTGMTPGEYSQTASGIPSIK